MKRLRPPIIGGHVQPGDGRRGVEQLRQFLVGRHPRDQMLGKRIGLLLAIALRLGHGGIRHR
ncbi:hypothetical protein QE379_001999 [Sphingomonas sp. SORGH_AS 879]|nr:hypothetical protein [Sphingomonas sp. SORGH_AS_0879]